MVLICTKMMREFISRSATTRGLPKQSESRGKRAI
nr:MAG TPA: hypothetical protein [Caudoviricetes sp.]